MEKWTFLINWIVKIKKNLAKIIETKGWIRIWGKFYKYFKIMKKKKNL